MHGFAGYFDTVLYKDAYLSEYQFISVLSSLSLSLNIYYDIIALLFIY